jgi:hypothetical protein
MDNQGGYDVMHRVLMERFDCIPSTIELVRKTPKTYDKRKALKQRCLIESFQAYPCKHLGVIKFLNTIHSKTMEAYTLSWNGNMLQNMKYLAFMKK